MTFMDYVHPDYVVDKRYKTGVRPREVDEQAEIGDADRNPGDVQVHTAGETGSGAETDPVTKPNKKD